MKRQARRDTRPELALRRELHRSGLRYRVDRKVLPGVNRRADVVFLGARVAVFVDGCFWHSCPQHATQPKANSDWWSEKLARNVLRDRETDQRLEAAGWAVVRVWEHEDPRPAAGRIRDLIERRSSQLGPARRSADG
jgi:DNA mismatch endonuclease (patch repair protein)